MTRTRASLTVAAALGLFVAIAAVTAAFLLASSPLPGTAPVPTPYPCAGGGR